MKNSIHPNLFDELDTAIALFHREPSGEFSLAAINPAGATIEKQKRDTLIGMKHSTLFPNTDRSGLSELLKNVNENGKVKKARLVISDFAGKLSVRELKLVGLEDGKIAMLYRLAPETPGPDDILRQWKCRTATVTDVMGRIAHQWRQPLSVITLIMQVLQESYAHGELDAAFFDKQLKLFMREVMFLSQTIDEFRNFFADDPVRNSFAVLPAIRESRRYFFTGENARLISVEITGDDFWLYTYPGEFSRVVLILLENAREAIEKRRETSPEIEGHITITTRRTDTTRLIRIQDNGGGIPPETIEKIFDPYFTTKFESRGTGMNLYIAKILTEHRLGGSLHARNSKEGAIFTLEFDN